MNPVFIAGAAGPLYAVYHPPAVPQGPVRGVLLCNPYGQEAVRAHRTFRVLADRLTRAGVGVMRFDYHGTGDSDGECRLGTIEVWMGDLLAAHAHLLRLVDGGPVVWVGLRLGGALAFEAARADPDGLGGIVLWEPVVDGAGYLEELRLADEAYLRSTMDDPTYVGSDPSPAEGGLEPFGFEMGAPLRQALQRLRIGPDSPAPRIPVSVVSHDLGRAEAAFSCVPRAGGRLRCVVDGDGDTWNSDRAMNAFLVPQAALAAVVECATQRW